MEKRFNCENIINKCSQYFSCYFGNSTMFSYDNIVYMRKFYRYFPIYLDKMGELEWESYLELLKLKNRKACYFYFNLSLFFGYDYESLKNVVDEQIYFRI